MDIGYFYVIGVVIIVIFFYFATKEPSFNPQPPKDEDKISGDLTLEELKQYNGETKPQVFVAVKGIIYDVSSSDFYRKGAAYGVFAGHDASINLGNMSHDEKLLNKWPEHTLDEDKTQILNDWVSRFQEKYRVVGNVKL